MKVAYGSQWKPYHIALWWYLLSLLWGLESPRRWKICKLSRRSTTSFIFGRFVGKNSMQRIPNSVIAKPSSAWPHDNPSLLASFCGQVNTGLYSFLAQTCIRWSNTRSGFSSFSSSQVLLAISPRRITPNENTSQLVSQLFPVLNIPVNFELRGMWNSQWFNY